MTKKKIVDKPLGEPGAGGEGAVPRSPSSLAEPSVCHCVPYDGVPGHVAIFFDDCPHVQHRALSAALGKPQTSRPTASTTLRLMAQSHAMRLADGEFTAHSVANIQRELNAMDAGADALDMIAASTPPVQETWQPIDSAPRDGRPFLVSWSTSLMGDPAVDMVGSWAEYEEILGYGEPPATHWCPIPAPPERPTHG